MQARHPAKICREETPGGFRISFEEGMGLTPTSRVQQGWGGDISSQPVSPPIESRGNPHHWLPYVDHKAIECSPAQVPLRMLAPFVSRQLSDNF